MPSSPYSSFADCSLLQQLCIYSCSIRVVPSPWPWATCGQKGSLCGHRWTFSLWLPSADPADHQGYRGRVSSASRASFCLLRGSQRGLRSVSLVPANPCCLTICCRFVLPCLSSLLLGCKSHCRSAQINVGHMGLKKHCTFSGTFCRPPLVLGRLQHIQLRFIQLHPWS